jgi:hypothetical protein
MIITEYANLWALAERIGDCADEGDAQTALDNLIEAGWSGWDTIDMPDGILAEAAVGAVAGPEA